MVSMPFLLLRLFVLSLMWLSSSSQRGEKAPIALPGCPDYCGDVMIPYPFGIRANCSHDESYLIYCNTSFHPPKPFLLYKNYSNLEVTSISSREDDIYGSQDVQKLTVSIPSTRVCSSDATGASVNINSIDFSGSPFRYSGGDNIFRVDNCGISVVLKNRSGDIVSGCASVCAPNPDANFNKTNCYGFSCCEAPLPQTGDGQFLWDTDLDFYQISVDNQTPLSSNSCISDTFVFERPSRNSVGGGFSQVRTFPVVLQWRTTYLSTKASQLNSDTVNCYEDSPELFMCYCKVGYEGNPYLPNGCQAVQACQKCRHNCEYNSTGDHYYCKKHQLPTQALILGFSIGVGLVLLILFCYWVYRLVKWRKEVKRKAKHFKRNGGLLLQQQMSSCDGVVEHARIFTTIELEKATDNFDENRILGQGGQGTVYKGILMDGQIVAIKKSKEVDESQLEQFINEVVILSQINHRNVVKLIGCCLETEVPLLVYEFISNGTLYQLIQDPNEDFHVSWQMRLQIAAESANALTYLHSASSTPIYHRDIKSSNILMDDKYRAKLSDFGVSRAISIEQTHVTTCVLGTYGYMDPEYFQSNQYTVKSDVYSFGVVLAELLTGRKPISGTSSGGLVILANEFVSKMENSELLNILDSRIIEEAKQEELFAVADLARRCLNMNGKHRPTMKEIVRTVQAVRSIHMPVSEEQNQVGIKCDMLSAIRNMQNVSFNSTTYFSDDCSTSYYSVEVQPLMVESKDN